jgi:hypothetical protein
MNDYEWKKLMDEWEEIEKVLDYQFSKSSGKDDFSTKPISSELETIRALLGSDLRDVKYSSFKPIIATVELWINAGKSDKKLYQANLSIHLRPLTMKTIRSATAAAPKAPVVTIIWEISKKDKDMVEGYSKFITKLQDGKNYDEKTGEPRFADAHTDDTSYGRWKLQVDTEDKGKGSVARLSINVKVENNGFTVTVKRFNQKSH